MTRRTYVYDRDLEAVVEITRTNREPQPRRSDGVQIIRDIEPYVSAGSDTARGKRQIVVGGRAQHRDFLRRNNYVEVGNEWITPKPPSYVEERRAQAECVADIKRAAGLL